MLIRKILIVDDLPEDRESVAMALRRDPFVRYQILEASTGEEGLALLIQHADTLDLAFLDFVLPDMDANAFVDKLLSDHEIPPVPIVVLTGSLPPESQGTESLRRGVQDFFTKYEATSSVVSRIAQNAIERHKLLRRMVETERQTTIAFENAARADRAKSQFLALISHELRTPLTAILGFCRLLQIDPDCQDRDKMLSTVISSGEHLEQLLNDLIDIAKVEAGSLELDPIDFDPRELVKTTLSLLGKRANDKGIRLELDIDVSTPTAVHADAVRFRQILVNLVGNAIKFTDKGLVQVSVCWDSTYQTLELRVADTGPGIPESLIRNLFTPFKQGESDYDRKREGAGLGLSISQQLARMMGGDLCLAKTSDKGTEFAARIIAPKSSSPTVNQKIDETRSYKNDLKGKRIIAADDVGANRFLLDRLLAQTEAKVTIVSDGAAVLECIGAPNQPNADLILMDMLMPVLDGYEATRELRRRGFQIPIIALTAAASNTDYEVCLNAGCNAVITKPINMANFYSVLSQTLNSKS